MKLRLTSLLLLSICFFAYGQNCDLSIDLPSEIVVCEPGSTTLNPDINNAFLTAQWSPTTGISDPTSATTTLTVSSSETYTLTIESISTTELIFNGDFSMGDVGFTSDYIYGTGGGVGLLSNEGQYAIADNAGDTHNQFADCDDHTGGGNMMVVNASGDLSNLWCQQITVSTNTDYQFSAWVASVTSQNPAQLQFSINGVLLGSPFNATSQTCQWQPFFADWNSGNTTDAEICIVNSNLTPAGNDFALDDISFRERCTTTATIDIVLADLLADIDGPTDFCTGSDPVSLDEYLNGSTAGGEWTIDGQAATTLNPATLSAGDHQLSYTVSQGTCTVSDELTFTVAEAPAAGSGSQMTACLGEFADFDLFSELSNAEMGGSWSYADGSPNAGNLNASSGVFTVSNAPADTYTFWYIVTGNGVCPNDTASVSLQLTPNPVADLPATAVLDCTEPTITLSGANTSTGPGFTYTWSINGVPTFDNNQPSLLVTEEGLYSLEVLNQATGCSSTAATAVSSLVAEINFELIATPAPCADPNSGSLAIGNIAGGTPPYLASINDEAFLPTDAYTDLAPGNYTVVLQDAAGCQTTETASLPTPVTPEVQITASEEGVIPLGSEISLRVITQLPPEQLDSLYWTPMPPGCEGCTLAQIVATEPITYTVTAVDNNGCVGSAQIDLAVSPVGNVFFPNAFSPNGDGVNDRFIVYDNGSISQITEFHIFDRWGNQVFQANNFLPNSTDQSWDGRFLGERVSEGVYIYTAEVQWINGQFSQISGEITVIY